MSEHRSWDKLEDLIHDVNSACCSLKEAASILHKASPAEARELLTLMNQQARDLARSIADADQRRPFA
jgi:hypothetical protein